MPTERNRHDRRNGERPSVRDHAYGERPSVHSAPSAHSAREPLYDERPPVRTVRPMRDHPPVRDSRFARPAPKTESFDSFFGQQRSGHSPGRGKPPKQHRPGPIARIVNAWFNRLLGAAAQGSFVGQEELYAAHRSSRDYLWNSAAIASWGAVFPLLTVVVTQIVGVERAGMFSMAFVVGTLLMFLANYGVRTYQVSDIEETHSFYDYQLNRILTCVVVVMAGIGYCSIRGYASEMFSISMAVYLYKMFDGLADVYEGRLQQVDKLYLAGVSQTIRSLMVLVVFSLCLLITQNLVVACIAMAVVAALSLLLVTLPLAFLESPRSRKFSFAGVASLFKQCFPLAVALFSYALIDSMPKFVMEVYLSYDNQLYFNALYFPAQAILLSVGLVYKPQLLRMAQIWADPKHRRRFDLIVLAVLAVIVVLVFVMVFFMGWIGIPLMSFLYGIDFEQFRDIATVMVVAGGVTAAIDFLYQVVTVLRKQMAVMKLYLMTFGFALLIPILLIGFTGLPGAILSYLIVMSILLVLLVMEFFRIRFAIARESKLESERETKEQPAGRRRRPREESAVDSAQATDGESRTSPGQSTDDPRWQTHEESPLSR